MASRRSSSSCALCERSNLPSCCSACVNARLSEYHARLRMMRNLRDPLHSRVAARLEAKRKADEQRSWRVSKAQDIKELRDRLSELTRRNVIEKKKVEQASSDLRARTASLNLAFVTLKKKQADSLMMHTNAMKAAQMGLMATTSERLKRQSKAIKQLCRLFPMRRVIIDGEKKAGCSSPYDAICGARLPRGLDPHTVPSEELSASLGYILQLLNIAVPVLSAPALHVSGFGASCSRIWQRSSYWSTRQSQRLLKLLVSELMGRECHIRSHQKTSPSRLVLGNALYFEGAWTEKFDASKTKDGEFHLLDGSSVQAPFMSSTNKQYLSLYDNLKVLKLPYQQGADKRQFSMYILLPEAQDCLWSLAEKLSSEPEFLEKHIPTQKVAVGQFKLHKFKISFGFEASDLLKGLGLQLPFSAEVDLSEMVDSPVGQSLYVSSIFHKSFVEVNEEGTEAAAASAAVISLRSLRIGPMDFVADHPFLFLI